MKNTFLKHTFLILICQLIAFICNAALTCAKPDYEALESTSLPKAPAWSRMDPKSRADWAENITAALFEKAGFDVCPSKHPVGEQGADGLFIYTHPKTRERIIVINETKYRAEKLSLGLGEMTCAKCDGGAETCIQMSWKWIRNAIYWIESESPDHCKTSKDRKICRDVCPWVRNHILAKNNIRTVIRTANVMNADGDCKFYALGDTPEERASAEKVLKYVLSKNDM